MLPCGICMNTADLNLGICPRRCPSRGQCRRRGGGAIRHAAMGGHGRGWFATGNRLRCAAPRRRNAAIGSEQALFGRGAATSRSCVVGERHHNTLQNPNPAPVAIPPQEDLGPKKTRQFHKNPLPTMIHHGTHSSRGSERQRPQGQPRPRPRRRFHTGTRLLEPKRSGAQASRHPPRWHA